MLRFIPAALIAAALAVGAVATPAQAQATRTWVSGVGDDANPCSRTAPCKTFAGAISKTAAAGEINCIDPGGYGALTITKSITIKCDEVEAGVLVSATNGFVIAAADTDRVVISGLDFEGLGPTALSLNGIKVNSAASVVIKNCRINGFGSTNGTDGNGVFVTSSTANGHVLIQDSLITNNASAGIKLKSTAPQVVSVLNTTSDGNVTFAAQVDGSGSTGQVLGAANSTFSNSPTGMSVINGGTAISIGPSNVLGGAGAFSSTVAFK